MENSDSSRESRPPRQSPSVTAYVENGDLSRIAWDLLPDSTNLKTISALLAYVQAGLSGASDDIFDFCAEDLRNAVDAAIADKVIPSYFMDRFNSVIQAVETMHAENRFSAACAAFAQSADDLPADPRPGMIDAAMQAGASTPETARSIISAIMSAARAR